MRERLISPNFDFFSRPQSSQRFNFQSLPLGVLCASAVSSLLEGSDAKAGFTHLRNRAAIARYLRATVIVLVKRVQSDASDFAGFVAYGLAGADC